MSVGSDEFRCVLGHHATGVCAITAEASGELLAMIVGSFTSVSLDPPLVGFFPDRRSTTWPKLQAAGGFSVNVLAATQLELCRALARGDRRQLHDLARERTPAGMPLLAGSAAWIECRLHDVQETGDHFLVLGRVTALGVGAAASPLIFHQGGYGQVAPTPVA